MQKMNFTKLFEINITSVILKIKKDIYWTFSLKHLA